MREEMRSIRSLLEAQLGRLLWDEQVAAIARHRHAAATLHAAGPGSRHRPSARHARRHGSPGRRLDSPACARWSNSCPSPTCDVVADGGVYAVIGPTGVGKTTSIAKLAARAAQQYGPEAVGLVTTDTFRVAAREQLETFGQIMGVSVTSAADSPEPDRGTGCPGAPQAGPGGHRGHEPARPAPARTAGPARGRRRGGHHPPGPAGHYRLRSNAGNCGRVPDGPAGGCILTKTDEATSLGGALSVLIRSGLPLAYVANGQRVPEDLHLMRNRAVLAGQDGRRTHAARQPRD